MKRTILAGLAAATLAAPAIADQIRFDRPSEWREWSLPLGAVELDGDVIRTVELRRGTDAISNLADFDGGIRAAGSNTATARRTIDGSEATGWEPDWDRPAEDWYIEIDLGRAVNASSVSLVFDDEAPAFELFDLLLSTGEPETDFIAAPIPGTVMRFGRIRCCKSMTNNMTIALTKTSRANSSALQPTCEYCMTNRSGVASSTIG